MITPKPGDVFVLTKRVVTDAGKEYHPGDEFTLIELTDDNPFGYLSPLGNWRVKCKFFEPPDDRSIWSSIWFMLDRELLIPA